jgi:hypothetical protein
VTTAKLFFGAKTRDRLLPDPDEPDYHGKRFLGLCYRLARAILAQKGVIGAGQSIGEVDQVRSVDIQRPLESTAPIMGDSPFAGSTAKPGEDSDLHVYTALQLELDPADPILFWLEAEHLGAFWPDQNTLLRFEARLLKAAGKKLLDGGRLAAFQLLESIIGTASNLERRDLLALPFAYTRDFSTASTDDDRAVMVGRLEKLANRAKVALDLRVEHAVLRSLASVQGLHAVDGDKSQRELVLLLGQPRNRQHDPDPPSYLSVSPEKKVLPG